MQFGWVSNTHSLSHATKLRKKSHEEIQLTTKTKTQIKALECFLQERLLGNQTFTRRFKQQREPKEQMKINSDSLFIFIKQVYQKSSYSSTVYVQSKLHKKPGKIPNNPQETDQLWNPISYQN
jgi:hypothetical protein